MGFRVKFVQDKTIHSVNRCQYKKVTVLLQFNMIPNVVGFTHCVCVCVAELFFQEGKRKLNCHCVSFIQSISISPFAKLSFCIEGIDPEQIEHTNKKCGTTFFFNFFAILLLIFL